MIPFSLLAHLTTYTSFLCWFQWLPWCVHFPADPGLLSDSMLFLTSQCDSVLPDFTETLQLPSYPHITAVHISSVLEDGVSGYRSRLLVFLPALQTPGFTPGLCGLWGEATGVILTAGPYRWCPLPQASFRILSLSLIFLEVETDMP